MELRYNHAPVRMIPQPLLSYALTNCAPLWTRNVRKYHLSTEQVLPGTVWKVLGSIRNELKRYQVCAQLVTARLT